MRKLMCTLPITLTVASILYAGCLEPAEAQNVQCTTRPLGDSTNACASTAFVQSALGNIPLTNAHIFVGNASNIATDVAMSGAVSITNTGLTSLTTSAFANPSATLGLSAINGSAVTAMRSDAAPALSQAIIPTWTGLHTWTAGMVGGSSSTSSFTLAQNDAGHTYTPVSGVAPGNILFRTPGTNCSGNNIYTTPGIGPAPSAGQAFFCADLADSAVGNFSNIYATMYNTGTSLSAALTGIGVAPSGSVGANPFGIQGTARFQGTATGIGQGANLECDHQAAATTCIAATFKIGSTDGLTTLNPGLAYFSTLADTGKAPLYGWRLVANSNSPIATTGSIIQIEGANLSATNGIDLNLGTFSGFAFRSPGFSVDPDGDTKTKTVGVRSTGAAFDMVITSNTVFTANRNLTFNIGDSARLIQASAGDLVFANAFTTSGAFPITLTATASTSVTLPISGTLASLSVAQTFTADHAFSSTSVAGQPLQIQLTEDSATVGPILPLVRLSASPAAADQIGSMIFYGQNSTATQTPYGRITGTIDDPVAGTEDASFEFETFVAGTSAGRMRVGNGIMIPSSVAAPGSGSLRASGTIRADTAFSANGTAGLSATTTVRDAAGTGTCTLIFTFGLKTGGTC